MATKPTAWQEPCPFGSLDELFNESRAKGDDSPLKEKMAPKAEPEEDIDILEPGAQVKTLQENQTVSKIKMANATKMENEGAAGIIQCTPKEREEGVTQLEQGTKKLVGGLKTQDEPEEPVELCEGAFLPLLSTGALSAGDHGGKEGFSSLEGEVAEFISDAEVISDPTEDIMSLGSQEWPKTSHIIEPADKRIDTTSEEMGAEKHVSGFHFVPAAISSGLMENVVSQTAHDSPYDSNNPHDAYNVSSPPFADESEEEEEVGIHNMDVRKDTSGKSIQSLYSASTNQEPDSALHANPSGKQQEELLQQNQCGPALKGANQEAAQQVSGQGFPPLSTVAMEPAMEPSNQGGAASQGCACVVAVRERHSRAGKRTEGENEQTGGVEGQKESRLERDKPAGQPHSRGLLRYSQTVQIQELEIEKHSLGVSLEHSKHTRMENDSCDDSQSDSGVSADFSPCGTLEGSPATVSRETPIEREIRKAMEREHSLRRSRGLPNLPVSPEYIEVPLRKTVLCHSVATKTEWCQDKDREFAGKKMQYEIQAEAQREQDLVKLGKVPGFYDKGTVRQIKEKKQLFEAFQTPSDSTFTVPTRSRTPSISSAYNISATENQENISSQVSTTEGTRFEKRHSLDLLNPAQSPSSPRGRGVTKSTHQGPGISEGPVLILENNLKNAHQDKPEAITVVDSGNPYISSSQGGGGHNRLTEEKQEKEEEEDLLPKENPFFKLRSSSNLVKVKQDIQEAQKREKELRKQRISLYGGSEDGGAQGEGGREEGRPVSMEVKSPTVSLNGLAVSDKPGSSSKGEAGPSAARPSVSKSFVWPPAQAEDEKVNRPEVLESPRTPRLKSPLVQRWESGLVNGHDKDND